MGFFLSFLNRPRQRLLKYFTQAPGLTRTQIYPVESLSILGSQEFIKEVTHQGEPRRVRLREMTAGVAIKRKEQSECEL